MKRSPRLVMITLVAAILAPSSAYADAGWWDWLDKLSGPGPFSRGWLVDFRVLCQVEDPKGETNALGEVATWTAPSFARGSRGRQCLVNAHSPDTKKNLVRSYFEVRGGRITSEDQPLFSDVPGELVGTVAAHQVMGVFMRQIDPMVAVGAGAGWMWFSGENISGNPGRFVVTPFSAAITPLKLISRINPQRASAVKLRIEAMLLTGGLEATDFNAASSSTFKQRGDFVTTASLMFDLFALFAR